MTSPTFFSVSVHLITVNVPLIYEVFINSSAIKEREHFVKIFALGLVLTNEDLLLAHKKYKRFYVRESDRECYLIGLASSSANDQEKMEVVKDNAINYLQSTFNQGSSIDTSYLAQQLPKFRDAMTGMVEVIKDYSIIDLQKLIGALSFHDFYTYDHSVNVSMYSVLIMKEWRPSANQQDLTAVALGGLLHDIGKINISTSIINKPDKISDDEFNEIKKHPEMGKLLIENQELEIKGCDLESVIRVIYEHHENHNGTGYPNQLVGSQIHPYAKITSIADFFDAITTKRSYHEPLDNIRALQVMEQAVGKKIDPYFFDLFKKLILKDEHFKNEFENKKDDISSLSKLPENFDPCQPCRSLPIEKLSPKEIEAIDTSLKLKGRVVLK